MSEKLAYSATVTITDEVAVLIDGKDETRFKGVVRYVGSLKRGRAPVYGVELLGSAARLVDTAGDGSIRGVRLFRCAPYRGVFVKRSKIVERRMKTKKPVPRITAGDAVRIYVRTGEERGVVRYIGTPVGRATSSRRTRVGALFYYGIELDKKKGDCDGIFNGERLFRCDHNCGIFVKSTTKLVKCTGRFLSLGRTASGGSHEGRGRSKKRLPKFSRKKSEGIGRTDEFDTLAVFVGPIRADSPMPSPLGLKSESARSKSRGRGRGRGGRSKKRGAPKSWDLSSGRKTRFTKKLGSADGDAVADCRPPSFLSEHTTMAMEEARRRKPKLPTAPLLLTSQTSVTLQVDDDVSMDGLMAVASPLVTAMGGISSYVPVHRESSRRRKSVDEMVIPPPDTIQRTHGISDTPTPPCIEELTEEAMHFSTIAPKTKTKTLGSSTHFGFGHVLEPGSKPRIPVHISESCCLMVEVPSLKFTLKQLRSGLNRCFGAVGGWHKHEWILYYSKTSACGRGRHILDSESWLRSTRRKEPDFYHSGFISAGRKPLDERVTHTGSAMHKLWPAFAAMKVENFEDAISKLDSESIAEKDAGFFTATCQSLRPSEHITSASDIVAHWYSAHEKDTSNPALLLNLGMALECDKHFAHACEYYNKALLIIDSEMSEDMSDAEILALETQRSSIALRMRFAQMSEDIDSEQKREDAHTRDAMESQLQRARVDFEKAEERANELGRLLKRGGAAASRGSSHSGGEDSTSAEENMDPDADEFEGLPLPESGLLQNFKMLAKRGATGHFRDDSDTVSDAHLSVTSESTVIIYDEEEEEEVEEEVEDEEDLKEPQPDEDDIGFTFSPFECQMIASNPEQSPPKLELVAGVHSPVVDEAFHYEKFDNVILHGTAGVTAPARRRHKTHTSIHFGEDSDLTLIGMDSSFDDVDTGSDEADDTLAPLELTKAAAGARSRHKRNLSTDSSDEKSEVPRDVIGFLDEVVSVPIPYYGYESGSMQSLRPEMLQMVIDDISEDENYEDEEEEGESDSLGSIGGIAGLKSSGKFKKSRSRKSVGSSDSSDGSDVFPAVIDSDDGDDDSDEELHSPRASVSPKKKKKKFGRKKFRRLRRLKTHDDTELIRQGIKRMKVPSPTSSEMSMSLPFSFDPSGDELPHETPWFSPKMFYEECETRRERLLCANELPDFVNGSAAVRCLDAMDSPIPQSPLTPQTPSSVVMDETEEKKLMLEKLDVCREPCDFLKARIVGTMEHLMIQNKTRLVKEIDDCWEAMKRCRSDPNVWEACFEMVKANIFRAFGSYEKAPPKKKKKKKGKDEDADDDIIPSDTEAHDDSHWEQLSAVHSLALKLFTLLDKKTKPRAKAAVDSHLVAQLVRLFGAPDAREHACARLLLREVYKKFSKLRPAIIRAMTHFVAGFAFGDARYEWKASAGISEIVQMLQKLLGEMKRGRMRKADVTGIWKLALLPLHKAHNLGDFHSALTSCVIMFLKKRSSLAFFNELFGALYKYWPVTGFKKQQLFIDEMTAVLSDTDVVATIEILHSREMHALIQRVIHLCGNSQHQSVVHKSVLFLSQKGVIAVLDADKKKYWPLVIREMTRKKVDFWEPGIDKSKDMICQSLRNRDFGWYKMAEEIVGAQLTEAETSILATACRRRKRWGSIYDKLDDVDFDKLPL